ncbi:MAG: c-type cytochrome, partial [Pirellula sp.]
SAWAKHADPSITVWILDRWDGATPTLRSEMFQALRGRPERMAAWLDRVEQGGASLNTLDATQLQSLRQIEGELQPRIHKLLEGRTNTNRQQVIDRYAVALSQSDLASVDMVRGKQLFSQHCAACHRVDGVGSAVGPDISDSRTQLPMQLLVSILDPNRAIDNNYFRITVRMTDGAIHDGIVVEESSQHLTLRNQNNPAMVFSKLEIDTIKSSGVSLMPEGIEAQIDETLMVDLIGYIKNWRYVGGEAPGLNTSGAPPQK